MANVFSERVAHLNEAGKTYQEMAVDCDLKPSVTWWNKARWNEIKIPPEPGLYPRMAKALEVPERRVAEMVAEQWCGVRPDDTVPERLRHLMAVARGVKNDEDLKLLVGLAHALSVKHGAESLVQLLDPDPAEVIKLREAKESGRRVLKVRRPAR
ncbi:hypothetical protein [Peterkaempfera bronchialis]|uniref:Uncharacterized protein n=1 Tax=Peterkaempfera bronchialis TaxID=2126346 RepID=A0A345SQU9_9ACTN|nr:hypothetical protein [Peterkaempfera bronchialis]AXI76104.1 hypothetical protein C7M71_000005 [Peterkaempfera bronchialis]